MEKLYAQASFIAEGGSEYTVDYTLVVSELEWSDGKPACESYGVGVTLNGTGLKNGTEKVVIEDITTSMTRIGELIKKLADGCVTPVTVMDVVEDYIA